MNVEFSFGVEDGTVDLNGRSVCIVDDDRLYRAHLAIMLGQAHLRTMEAGDSADLTAVLEKEMPDCILLDCVLEAENGFRLHEQLNLRFSRLAPVIMLSADESQRTAIKAFRMGFNDFLPKRNLRLEEVTGAIRKAIAKHDIDTARANEVSALRRNALFDDLTGMYCRAELDKKLELIGAGNRRSDKNFTILSIQLAEYRKICASFGLANGDDALRSFAGRIRANIRKDDFCGRVDEDTFHYVMDRNFSEASLRERMTRLTEQLTFQHHIKSVALNLAPLIAVAISAEHGNDMAEILDHLAAELVSLRDAKHGATVSEDWNFLPPSSHGDEDAGDERRVFPRMRTLKPAFIALEEWTSKINCTVRNTSDGGARLRLERPLALPEHFMLKITESGQLRRVRKCWHVNNEIGVEYADALV
ncbi:two-component system cell cycle response regulator [Hoeflea marina]|uniref:Two-component system cell cycle response regulator n=1 Tax=Hoeflea marina TaxID=274592 RepID=A0A317PLA5_9HYPH|nr:diguanylate cyclase [Hoeflea marina]PWW01712.1 two-component system cell cycle response regulator [Hoeflea marina]